MFGSFEFAFYKSVVDHHLRSDIGEFTLLPGLHLFSDLIKAALHPVHTDRDAVD